MKISSQNFVFHHFWGMYMIVTMAMVMAMAVKLSSVQNKTTTQNNWSAQHCSLFKTYFIELTTNNMFLNACDKPKYDKNLTYSHFYGRVYIIITIRCKENSFFIFPLGQGGPSSRYWFGPW